MVAWSESTGGAAEASSRKVAKSGKKPAAMKRAFHAAMPTWCDSISGTSVSDTGSHTGSHTGSRTAGQSASPHAERTSAHVRVP
eukprot:1379839-Prymnesium_polylepis.1